MKISLDLDDDVLDLLKDYAEDRSVALGKAASELVRRGLGAPVRTRLVNSFHAIVLPVNSPKVTSEKNQTVALRVRGKLATPRGPR
jgi:hypothetical protein